MCKRVNLVVIVLVMLVMVSVFCCGEAAAWNNTTTVMPDTGGNGMNTVSNIGSSNKTLNASIVTAVMIQSMPAEGATVMIDNKYPVTNNGRIFPGVKEYTFTIGASIKGGNVDVEVSGSSETEAYGKAMDILFRQTNPDSISLWPTDNYESKSYGVPAYGKAMNILVRQTNPDKISFWPTDNYESKSSGVPTYNLITEEGRTSVGGFYYQNFGPLETRPLWNEVAGPYALVYSSSVNGQKEDIKSLMFPSKDIMNAYILNNALLEPLVKSDSKAITDFWNTPLPILLRGEG
jgi:hypothetical protein